MAVVIHTPFYKCYLNFVFFSKFCLTKWLLRIKLKKEQDITPCLKEAIMVEFGMHEFPRTALDMKATGKVLRDILMKKKIKVEDIARYLNISPQSIYN